MEYIGEIRMFGGNFAMRNWAFCNGQLLPISGNSALFSLIGTIYGGDGRTTFALPDLRGRIATHSGTGPGLSPIKQGARSGHETVTLTLSNIPSHSHAATLNATAAPAAGANPSNKQLAAATTYADHSGTNIAMYNQSVIVGNTGGGQNFNIRNPYLGIQFIICLYGVFPSRS